MFKLEFENSLTEAEKIACSDDGHRYWACLWKYCTAGAEQNKRNTRRNFLKGFKDECKGKLTTEASVKLTKERYLEYLQAGNSPLPDEDRVSVLLDTLEHEPRVDYIRNAVKLDPNKRTYAEVEQLILSDAKTYKPHGVSNEPDQEPPQESIAQLQQAMEKMATQLESINAVGYNNRGGAPPSRGGYRGNNRETRGDCRDFQRGRCGRGTACRYMHHQRVQAHPGPQTDKECWAFARQGGCRFGDNCRFSHVNSGAPSGRGDASGPAIAFIQQLMQAAATNPGATKGHADDAFPDAGADQEE